jgi:hypothetical protein
VLDSVPERSVSVSKARVPNLGQLDEVVGFHGLPSDDFDASKQTSKQTSKHERITTVPVLAS